MGEYQVTDNLQKFRHGTDWSSETARKALPVLVRWAEEEARRPDSEPREFTYTMLAAAVGEPGKAHPTHLALGILGFALQELELQSPLAFGKIPPIQLLVWSKGTGSPGDRGFGFIGLSKAEVESLKPEARRLLARGIRKVTVEYPHWRRVLRHLDLKPLTLDLPDPDAVILTQDSDWDGRGKGEKDPHKRLKFYVGENYALLGLDGRFEASYEDSLISGDQTDLQLSEVVGSQLVCVEAKSRISNNSDLIRGIFQCVKYQHVLAAQEAYKSARDASYVAKAIRTILVTERDIDGDILSVSRLLNVEVKRLVVPD